MLKIMDKYTIDIIQKFDIKEFYKLYPNFDILFYKLFNKKLVYSKNNEYLLDYHNDKNKQTKAISINDYINKYNVDFYFLKNFYEEFDNKPVLEILIKINENIDYMVSDKVFSNKFPDFNINIYKIFNPTLTFKNDIKYKRYWYFFNQSENKISSLNDIKNIIDDFDIDFFKHTYNISNNIPEELIYKLYNNDKSVIYSYNRFRENIDDFNFLLFLKKYPKFYRVNKDEIIDNYLLNISKINEIYSFKYLNIKYPLLELEEFKRFNKNYENILNKLNFINNYNIIFSVKDFYIKYDKFNIELYKNILFLRNNIIFDNDKEYIYYWYENDRNKYYTDFINDFYLLYPTFDINIYKYFNNDNNSQTECIYFSKSIHSELNNDDIYIYYDFLNKIKNNLLNLENIIYSKETFYSKYKKIDKYIYSYENNLENYTEEELIIHYHSIEIKKNKLEDNYEVSDMIKLENKKFDKRIVNNINDVLYDLENQTPKNQLEKGISLIIRAKNEELNIKTCIESVVDLVDEIIFVDNNSTDNTYDLINSYQNKYPHIIKVYQYNINVSKVGNEHSLAIKNNNKNTLGTFYNWCLSKATKYNVFKWDADFICIRNNLIQMINKYNLRNREDKFALWFTGKTLFENNNEFYVNNDSYYNEFRVFSFFNNFCWYDGNTCEYTDPYINSVKPELKYKYEYPLFYEIKRTSLDEFKERSSLIDSRDINDFNILNMLKKNTCANLVKIDYNTIILPELIEKLTKKIIIYTPSLTFGGGNQFIINLYIFYKSFGFNVLIVPNSIENYDEKKFSKIFREDIINSKNFNIQFIETYKPNFIIFNSDVPFNRNELNIINNISKSVFVTHSDVAYSNYLIKEFHLLFYKIITVNEYTKIKLINILNINPSKIVKIINYTNEINISSSNNSKNTLLINKTYNKINSISKSLSLSSINNNKIVKKFALVSRFSEDKNIPMLLFALANIFYKFPSYQCYLIGSYTSYYDDYLKFLITKLKLNNNILFEGYQQNVSKYYNIIDFVILPSVSEGTSYNIIEALNFGLPVICSDVGGNHELIKNDINGIIFEYEGIKKFEENNLFIKNYNEQLSILGYVINNELIKEKYNNYIDYNKLDVLLPNVLECKCKTKGVNNINNCIFCNELINKKNIFEKNIKLIFNAINRLLEFDDIKIDKIKENNKNFIKDFFNKDIYIKNIFEII